jgi:hypothetical protein
MNVKSIKQKLRSQGANVTYQSARVIALSSQIQNDVKENLVQQCGMHFCATRPTVNKLTDIKLITEEVM